MHKFGYVTETKCEIRLGDCKEVLREYPDSFFDLIVTSPPYVDRALSLTASKLDEDICDKLQELLS